jgi:hypothetical protein
MRKRRSSEATPLRAGPLFLSWAETAAGGPAPAPLVSLLTKRWLRRDRFAPRIGHISAAPIGRERYGQRNSSHPDQGADRMGGGIDD